MGDQKKRFLHFINNFETYIGAVVFVFLTIFLTIQVISRYVFSFAFTWAEELAVILFVWLVYLGTSAAILKRKHLRIETLLDAVPFKAKKVLLITSNFVFMAFCIYIIFPMTQIINNMMMSHAVTPLLRLPKAYAYMIMPICMILTAIRLIQENMKLFKEDEQNFAATKPMMDLGHDEREIKEVKLK